MIIMFRIKRKSLLEVIFHKIACTYLSDLRYEPYNSIAKQILKQINLKSYSNAEIYDAFEYLFDK